jgi:hypothetical protein
MMIGDDEMKIASFIRLLHELHSKKENGKFKCFS